jgi:hypothetical protein
MEKERGRQGASAAYSHDCDTPFGLDGLLGLPTSARGIMLFADLLARALSPVEWDRARWMM